MKHDDSSANFFSQCAGKTRYPSAHKAGKAKDGIAKRHARSVGIHVYHCGYCGHWHVGNRVDKPMKMLHRATGRMMRKNGHKPRWD